MSSPCCYKPAPEACKEGSVALGGGAPNRKREIQETGEQSSPEFDSGQAMLGTSGVGASPVMQRTEMYHCTFTPRQSGCCNPRLHVMSPPDVTDRLGLCLAESSTKHPSDKDLQRADGCGRIVLSGSENGTRIEDVFERSPIRIMFPRTGHCRVEEGCKPASPPGLHGYPRKPSSSIGHVFTGLQRSNFFLEQSCSRSNGWC